MSYLVEGDPVATVKRILDEKPGTVVWTQANLAAYLARVIDGNDGSPERWRRWLRAAAHAELGEYALIDHEGKVQGYANMLRLMACMPDARSGE